MAGYYGYSMSNNALDAYSNGEKPKSKWTKKSIINELQEYESHITQKVKELPLDFIKRHYLKQSSWHHTSCKYNVTNFFTVNTNALVRDVENGYVDTLLDSYYSNKKVDSKPIYCGIITVQVWGGSRRHPKIVRFDTVPGYIKGDWLYYNEKLSKYKLSANKTEQLEKFENLDELLTKYPVYQEKKDVLNEILKKLNKS